MKLIALRALAFGFVLVGTATVVPASSTVRNPVSAATHSGFMPVASCPPNDPNACGFK